ncbi:MAG: hypothetical protein ACU84Q_03000 [Gammaproteobacteria bacterium]
MVDGNVAVGIVDMVDGSNYDSHAMGVRACDIVAATQMVGDNRSARLDNDRNARNARGRC